MPPSAAQSVLTVGFSALFGAAVGSFLNVCIYRLPRPGLALHRPSRSFCPVCGEPIAGRDNLPIASWIALGGRCRSCRAPIPIRYLVVEAVTAALFALVVHRHVLEGEGSWLGAGVLLAFACGLVVASFVDIDLRLIPDEITVAGMHLLPVVVLVVPELHVRAVDPGVATLLTWLAPWLEAARGWLPAGAGGRVAFPLVVGGVVTAGFLGGALLYRAWRRRLLPELPRRLRDVSLAGVLAASTGGLATALVLRPGLAFAPRAYALAATLAGMLAGSALVWLVGVVGTRVFRKPAMGFGDVKLMGFLGALAGWKGAVLAFFLACLLGSVIGIVRLLVARDRYLPFGPFLAAGGLVVVLWPEGLDAALAWYLNLFRA